MAQSLELVDVALETFQTLLVHSRQHLKPQVAMFFKFVYLKQLAERERGGGQGLRAFFTSVTTGGPKGVVLSHANQLAQARSKLAAIPLHRGSRYLCTLALFHIAAGNGRIGGA